MQICIIICMLVVDQIIWAGSIAACIDGELHSLAKEFDSACNLQLEKESSQYLWAHVEFGRLTSPFVVCSWQDVSEAALL